MNEEFMPNMGHGQIPENNKGKKMIRPEKLPP